MRAITNYRLRKKLVRIIEKKLRNKYVVFKAVMRRVIGNHKRKGVKK